MYYKYLGLVALSLFASALNFLLAPVVVLFASQDGWLPKWLWWFQTPGDSLDKDYRGKRFPGTQVGLNRWYSRVTWLYRNSMYGFCIDVLGAKLKNTDTIEIFGDVETSNRPIHSGKVKYIVSRDGVPIYFQWYYVKQWSSTRCIRINLGWKVWGWTGEEKSCQLTFSPNPFMGLRKEAD